MKFPRFPIPCSSSGQSSSSISSLDFDKTEGEFLLSGNNEGTIRLFKIDLREGDESGRIGYGNVDNSNSDSDGDGDGVEMVGELSRKHGSANAHRFGITNIQWWPNDVGMFLSSSHDGSLKIWDSSTLMQAFEFQMEGSKINNFSINERTSTLAVACENSSHIRLIDLKSSASLQSLQGHDGSGSVLSCQWSPTRENVLASGGSTGEVKVWDVRFMKRCVLDLDLHSTSTSTSAATSLHPLDEPHIKRPKQATLQSSHSRSKKAHIAGVNGLKFHENGKTLITTGGDDKIRVWNLDSNINTLLNFGPLVRNRRSSKSHCKTMVLSPLGETEVQYLFYPSDTGEILMFRAFDAKLVTRLKSSNHALDERNVSLCYSGFNKGVLFSGTSTGKIQAWGSTRDDLSVYDEDNNDVVDSDEEI